ncbi:GcrA family cell cycle regulator [Bradyrhizobium sp. PMVTL-01]|uniref:GcrA family cell cycle regulator n=1 Tax=Bradyrhizobium sp. PMVTL-01 TaxID=3434999 RepID=UPI003F70957A
MIANELTGRSRNAVLGLIARKQFTRSNQPPREKVARSPKPPMRAQPKQRATRDPVRPASGEDRTEQPAQARAYGAGISLLELRNDTCRWPKGTPGEAGFAFCGELGADLSENRPYCPFHMNLRKRIA